MLDIKYVRENQEAVAEAMKNRNASWDAERFSSLDENRRAAIVKEEALQQERNAASKSIGEMMREGKKDEAETAKERVRAINPNCTVTTHKCFYLPETKDQFDFTQYDYVVDAIDTVSGKLALVEQAKAAGTPIICAMGAGNKVDPTAFRVADIYETSVCPLARVMRVQCRKRGIKKLKVVYSQEKPLRPVEDAAISCRNHCICPPGTARKYTDRRDIPGSTAFVPPVVGLIIAGEVVKDLAGEIAAKPAKG